MSIYYSLEEKKSSENMKKTFMIKWKARWTNHGNKERVVVVLLGKEFNLCVNNEKERMSKGMTY